MLTPHADDTLLVGSSLNDVQDFLKSVEMIGRRFCLELYFSKFQLLEVNGNHTLRTPAGNRIEAVTSLGSTLYKDASLKRELNC